jgi:FkbM family methyltransferase
MNAPKDIPTNLVNRYTMGGNVQIERWYIDETEPQRTPLVYTKAQVNAFLKDAEARQTKYYGDTDSYLYQALDKYNIADKQVAIMGSQRPWYESICLLYGGKPTVIDYHKIYSERPDIETITIEDYKKNPRTFDTAFSISSFEHDGLGRYGDPLGPDADLVAMDNMRNVVKEGGLLFLSVPVGKDKVVWNAHRIYGRKRLPSLLNNWCVLDAFGFDEHIYGEDTGVQAKYQPVLVLKNTGHTPVKSIFDPRHDQSADSVRTQTLIFIHIPKAAGSTLSTIIKNQFSEDHIFQVNGTDPAPSIQQLKTLDREDKRSLQCVMGHMAFGLHETLPQAATYITMLRDPVERIVSHYYYVLRSPHHYLHQKVTTENISLLDYVEMNLTPVELDNGQTRIISGQADFSNRTTAPPVTEAELRQAQDNLENHFSVVGLSERFDESIFLLQRVFGWNNISYERTNGTPGRPNAGDLPENVIRRIQQLNELDMALYETGKRQFERLSINQKIFDIAAHSQSSQSPKRNAPQMIQATSTVKLHLGCGTQRLPGFIHVDVRPDVKPDVIAEVTALTMFEDNSVDLIYFCHGLEHINPYQVGAALAEWRRVLKPGGTLRLALPDFEALAKLYVLRKVPLGAIVGAVHGGQDYPENTHYWSWDFATLAQTLQKAGFSNARRYDAEAVNPPGYDDCSKIHIAGQLISLNVEATKGHPHLSPPQPPPSTGQIVNLNTQIDGQTCSLKIYVDPREFTQKLMMGAFSKGMVYEPEVVQAFTKILKPGDGFIDVGAHIGYFSLWAATLVGESGWVVTCEPERSNYDRVLQNIQLNGFGNVRVLNVAVADENKEAQLFVNSDNDGGHALWDIGEHPFNQKSRSQPRPVPIHVATIDAIATQHNLSHLKLIKIDTEGAEHSILKGAQETLKHLNVPYVIAEMNEFCLQKMGSDQMQLRHFMQSLGYDTYVLSTQTPQPLRLESEQRYESQQLVNLLFANCPLEW